MAPITSKKKTKTKKTKSQDQETKNQNKTDQQTHRNKDSPMPNSEIKVKQEPKDSDMITVVQNPMDRLQKMKDCLDRYKQYQEDNRVRLLKHRENMHRLEQSGKLPKNIPYAFNDVRLRSAPYIMPHDRKSSLNFVGSLVTFPHCLTKDFFVKERELALEIWKHCRRDLCLSPLGKEFAKYCKPSTQKEEPKKSVNITNICRPPPGFFVESRTFENSTLAKNVATIDTQHKLCGNFKTASPEVRATRRKKKKGDPVLNSASSSDIIPVREFFNSKYLASNKALGTIEEDPDDEKYADTDWIDLLKLKPPVDNQEITTTVDTASRQFPKTVEEDVLKEEYKNSAWSELVTASNYSFEDIASMFDTTPTISNKSKEDSQEIKNGKSEWIGLVTARHSIISDDGSSHDTSLNLPKEDTPKKEYFTEKWEAGNIPETPERESSNTTKEVVPDIPEECIPAVVSEIPDIVEIYKSVSNEISEVGNEEQVLTANQQKTPPIVEGNSYVVPGVSNDSGKGTYNLYDRKAPELANSVEGPPLANSAEGPPLASSVEGPPLANSVEGPPLEVVEPFLVTPENLTGLVKRPTNVDPNAIILGDDFTVRDMEIDSQTTPTNKPPLSQFIPCKERVSYFQMYLSELDLDYIGSIKELMKSREVCMHAITNGFDNDSELQLLALANSNTVYIYDIKKYKKKRLPEELRLLLQDNKIQKVLYDARFLLQYFEERYHLKINNLYDIKAAAIVRTFRLHRERKADDVIMAMSAIFPDMKVVVPSISELRDMKWLKRPIAQETIDTLGSLCIFTIKFKEIVDETIRLLPDDSDSDE